MCRWLTLSQSNLSLADEPDTTTADAIPSRRSSMKVFSRLCIALFAAAALALSGQVAAQEKLTVWWGKGFYKSEDDALYEAIKKYEAKSGVKVELSQYAVQDGIPKVVAALDAGNPP